MNFIVRIARPVGDAHWRGLYEAAAGVAYALKQLGHGVHFNLDEAPPAEGRLIIFNAHRLGPQKIPSDAILFNSEQVPSPPVELVKWKEYLSLLRQHVVWEYSAANAGRLHAHGVERVVRCPIGWWPGLETIKPTTEDLDVLFVGSVNARRNAVFPRNLSFQWLFDVYGEERDAWIARAKVVLNVHYYPEPIFEIFRCAPLFANRKCVVTESGGCDTVLETLAMNAAYVRYERLAETCDMLANDEAKRRRIASSCYDAFRALDQVTFVRKALEES